MSAWPGCIMVLDTNCLYTDGPIFVYNNSAIHDAKQRLFTAQVYQLISLGVLIYSLTGLENGYTQLVHVAMEKHPMCSINREILYASNRCGQNLYEVNQIIYLSFLMHFKF